MASPTLYFPEDIVTSIDNPSHVGIVERTASAIDSHEPAPGNQENEDIERGAGVPKAIFRKFLRDGAPPEGFVFLRWTHTTAAYFVSTQQLKLLDRSLLIGDVVKQRQTDAMSGIVINTFTTCEIQPMCDIGYRGVPVVKGLLPPTPAKDDIAVTVRPPLITGVPASELMEVDSPGEQDLVIYRSWLGRVGSRRVALSLMLANGSVVEIEQSHAQHIDMDDELVDSFSVGDVAVTKKSRLRLGRWIFGSYNADLPPIGTVVETRVKSIDVEWLQERIGSSTPPPSPRLEREELESRDFCVYDRTRGPVALAKDTSLSEPETLVSNSEPDITLNARVRFRDLAAARAKYGNALPFLDRRTTLGYDINVFDTIRFTTDVQVQWQDLSVTRCAGTSVIPEDLEDESSAWPAEIVHSTELVHIEDEAGARPSGFESVMKPERVGVVQSVDAEARMAKVRWAEDATLNYHVHSEQPKSGERTPQDGLDEEAEKEGRALMTRAIGRAAGPIEEVSLYDYEAPAELNVRRGDIVLVAPEDSRFSQLLFGPGGQVEENRARRWLGEIVDTRLDGTLTVRLGAADQVCDIVVMREDITVAVRSDGTDLQGDDWDDDEDNSETGYDDYSTEDSDEEDDEVMPTYMDEYGNELDEDEVEDAAWESDSDDEMVDAEEGVHSAARPDATPVLPTPLATPPSPTSKRKRDSTLDDSTTSPPSLRSSQQPPSSAPSAYLMLSTPIPPSHHFSTEPSAPLANLKRITKDHRILSTPSALPPNIYIRTWESRLDLLRILIIGPTETPYAHAPFLFDLFLPPTYPSEPPRVFFHSWSTPASLAGLGGNSRVNPNLYEDGKVCLSLLGTWDAGTKSEAWSTSSTVLQLLVSLQGLVLVREPYFNEAGYEGLMGTEGAVRASRVYSERAYLRSRGFVISVLRGEAGVQGCEDVVEGVYKGQGRLVDVVKGDVEEVLGRSEEGTKEVDGISVVSKGACISLRRALQALEVLV